MTSGVRQRFLLRTRGAGTRVHCQQGPLVTRVADSDFSLGRQAGVASHSRNVVTSPRLPGIASPYLVRDRPCIPFDLGWPVQLSRLDRERQQVPVTNMRHSGGA